MTTLSASLADELQHDFSQARAQLAEARLHQAEKDTLEARAAVARWLSLIDAVLDMYLPFAALSRILRFRPQVHANPAILLWNTREIDPSCGQNRRLVTLNNCGATDHQALGATGAENKVRYVDPGYAIRSVPANP